MESCGNCVTGQTIVRVEPLKTLHQESKRKQAAECGSDDCAPESKPNFQAFIPFSCLGTMSPQIRFGELAVISHGPVFA
jgi:hypothetical protein